MSEEKKRDEMRSRGNGTREPASGNLSPAPVPQALLILLLRMVTVRRLPALRRGLIEVVPDAPAKEGTPAQVTPASPPAMTAGPAQRILQSPHGAHPPSTSPAPPERPGRLNGLWKEGRRNRRGGQVGASSVLESEA